MTQPVDASAAHSQNQPNGQPHVDALRSSVDRLRHLVAQLDEQTLTGRAYPSEWTVAQVLSHLGFGAVITQRRLEDGLAGWDTPADFAPGGWDSWNAEHPVAQRDDALEADPALLARIDAVAPGDRDRFTSSLVSSTWDAAGPTRRARRRRCTRQPATGGVDRPDRAGPARVDRTGRCRRA